VKTPEEITYDAGRHALAEQQSEVSGIRQRTGTLLAAHALVASFLGAVVIRTDGLHGWSWLALGALVVGLIVAAVLLAPWQLVFAVDPRRLYDQLYEQARRDVQEGSAEWLLAAALGYEQLRDENARRVDVMSALSAALAVLMVLQTLAWIAELLR
jgi:hypothetical protein